jgi:hypothetical protein
MSRRIAAKPIRAGFVRNLAPCSRCGTASAGTRQPCANHGADPRFGCLDRRSLFPGKSQRIAAPPIRAGFVLIAVRRSLGGTAPARALNDRPTLSPIGGARGQTALAFFAKTPANRQAPDSRAVRSCFGAMFPERELPDGAALTKRQ